MWHRLQQIYAEDLPALPLFFRADAAHLAAMAGGRACRPGTVRQHALGRALAGRGRLRPGAASTPVLRYLIHRLVEAALVLLLMSFVIYGLIGLMPGDPIDLMASGDPNITSADARAAQGGLRPRPAAARALRPLARRRAQGDFGYSRLYARPVLEVLLPRLGNTCC